MIWYIVIVGTKAQLQKVTVVLPKELVRNAMDATGEGLTPTIRQALEKVAAAQAYEGLRKMRGKVRFTIDVDDLREDRS